VEDAVIVVSGLRFRYAGGHQDALHEIDLEVGAGELVGVVGANGAGKSSLCYALTGYIPHFYGGSIDGDVLVAGHDVRHTPVSQLVADVGLVFQNPFNQISGARYTVLEEVAFGLENLGVAQADLRPRALGALRATGLEDLADRSPFTLSGGEQQRLAISAVIAMQPRVLVLDEPTSQLDPAGTRSIFGVLQRLARERKTTIVLSEHKLGWLAAFVDRLLVLDAGQLVADGSPREVLTAALTQPWGVGATRFTQAAQAAVQRRILPPASPLPVTLEQTLEWLR
jgi:energy-coupling factor transport system ATP-binding protein